MKNTKFNYLSQSASNFDDIDWKQGIKSMTVDGETHDGVTLVELPTGSIVFRSTDCVSTDIFLSRLAMQLGVTIPQTRAICYNEPEFKTMMKAIEKKCHSEDPVYKQALSRLNRPFYELIQYIRGIDLKSTGPSRFQKIFNEEANLVQLGSIIAFDMIVNNSDRLPIIHQTECNPENILFSIEPKEGTTWQMIHQDNNRDISFGSVYAVNTKHGIMDPQKEQITNMLVQFRKFLHDALTFGQQMFAQAEDEEIKTPVQFERMNKCFASYCLSVMKQEQVMAILKGIVICLDKFLKRLSVERIVEIKNSLMKQSGQWEETYWNHALYKLPQLYFQAIYKVVSAQWTVYEQTILKILNYSYIGKNQESREHIKIQENQSEDDINVEDMEVAPLPSHRTAQPQANQSIVNKVSKSNSVKESGRNSVQPSVKNKEPSEKIKEPSNKNKSQLSPSQKPSKNQSKGKSIKKEPELDEKAVSPGKKKLNYSKLDQKIRKFKERNE